MRLGSYPRLLVLALSLPAVSHALGLGNMRVDSKLNQPLSAQIELLGATPQELKALRASVATAAGALAGGALNCGKKPDIATGFLSAA